MGKSRHGVDRKIGRSADAQTEDEESKRELIVDGGGVVMARSRNWRTLTVKVAWERFGVCVDRQTN